MLNFSTSLIIKTPTCLKECKCVEGLARFLGFTSYSKLDELVYPSINHLYYSFKIPKKNGHKRIIKAPRKSLKSIQELINVELGNYFSPRNSTHGFIKNRSIVSNAAKHVDKKYVLNLDLENFFDSIHFGRVRNLFCSYPLVLSKPVATVLSHLCCYQGKLPQGAPTSPIISNMIAYRLDKEIQYLASNNRCTYTRYADDLTFSFTQKRRKLPKPIVKLSNDLDILIGHNLKDIILNNGFTINDTKTRISSKCQRQEVTGITVNERMNVPRSFIKQTRSMLYAWKTFGLENAELHYLDNYHKKTVFEKHKRQINKKEGIFFQKIVKGRINYIKMVRGSEDLIYRKIAYDYSVLTGKPNSDLIKTPLDKVCDSIFIIENMLDSSQGTAFLLKDIGMITNEHVVDGIDEDNPVLLEFFRHFEQTNKKNVTFKKSCKSRDLAILKPTKDFNGIKRLDVGDDTLLDIGSEVTVLGFPQYSPDETPYINTGKIIQSKILYGQKIWLLDIPIIHGNSGGPVLDKDQKVIGIASRGSEKHDQSTKLHGFIPISTLLKYFKEKP